MTTKLAATVWMAQVLDGVTTVCFADDEHAPAEYLLLQKSWNGGKQDVALGMDQVHITFCDQLRSAYGRILKGVLRDRSVDFYLDASTAQLLGTDAHLEVTFPPTEAMNTLRAHLQQIIGQALAGHSGAASYSQKP